MRRRVGPAKIPCSRVMPRGEVARIAKEIADAAAGGPKTFDPVFDKYIRRQVYVEAPLGELFNEKIRGHAWVWNLQQKIMSAPIAWDEKFAAQGLEGKFRVKTDLLTAINVVTELPAFRGQIVEKYPCKNKR